MATMSVDESGKRAAQRDPKPTGLARFVPMIGWIQQYQRVLWVEQLAKIGLKELELIFEWVGFGLHSSVLNCRVLMVHP